MIQLTPQMRIVVAVEPADFRRGIDGLARLCKEVLRQDPFGGWVFVFRNRRATALATIMTSKKPTIIDIEMDKLDEILRRVDAKELNADDCETIRAMFRSYVCLTELLKDKNTSIARLRKLLFGASTEKTAAVLGTQTESQPPALPASAAESAKTPAGDVVEESAEDAAEGPAKKPASERCGLFTSGVVSTRDGRRIALFFSGRKHAGENLKDVLAERAAELAPPIQMCDALSRNMPAELATIVSNCLAHGRRQFVDEFDRFPEECQHVLESLAIVYKNDALARERNLSPQSRLEFHQAESGPTMEELRIWLVEQFDQRRVEPNSALGGAMTYLLKRWEKLTLFLRMPGAPLDNNICERALKKAIRNRRNSLFYKTPRGARVGDVFMSLIHTCELGGVNPFDYLTEIERHAAEASAEPGRWMPWNYRQTLAEIATSPVAVG